MASIEARRPLKDSGLSSVWDFGITGDCLLLLTARIIGVPGTTEG